MSRLGVLYLVFGTVLLLAIAFDLGLLSKKNKAVSLRTALRQTIFWVSLSTAFCIFIFFENAGGTGGPDALSYLTAYLLEWSLSLDNIFVFLIIFSFFRIEKNAQARILMLGILMAVVFRIIFIRAGSGLVARFTWILYGFGIFLLYIGARMFSKKGDGFDPGNSGSYKLLRWLIPVTDESPRGRFFIRHDHKLFFTSLAVVVGMLGLTDVIFALDSIPAVFAVIPDPSKRLLIFSSNIFAVLGLRSLFFLLQGAADRFVYLQQGVATVLLFVGLKMLLPILGYFGVPDRFLYWPDWVSLLIIVVCIGTSIAASILRNKRNELRPPAND